MKFHLKTFNGYQLTEQTRNSIANDQREITPKISNAELWFLRMTHCLMVLYNLMKFHFNSFNGCQVTERTQNIQSRVMVLVQDTSSYCALQLYEVSFKEL